MPRITAWCCRQASINHFNDLNPQAWGSSILGSRCGICDKEGDRVCLCLRRTECRSLKMPTRLLQPSAALRADSEHALQAVGRELRAARLARGEDLDDISAYLRIKPAY